MRRERHDYVHELDAESWFNWKSQLVDIRLSWGYDGGWMGSIYGAVHRTHMVVFRLQNGLLIRFILIVACLNIKSLIA